MGRDIARAFHRNGDDVIVASRSDNGFAREFPERMHFVACDVRRPDDLHTLVRDRRKIRSHRCVYQQFRLFGMAAS